MSSSSLLLVRFEVRLGSKNRPPHLLNKCFMKAVKLAVDLAELVLQPGETFCNGR